MYYVSGISKDCIKVTDTNDNVEEVISKEDAIKLHKRGVCILGVQSFGVRFYFTEYTKPLVEILSTQRGTPIMLKWRKDKDFEQVIYSGSNSDDTVNFFDGSEIAGIFALSPKYFVENKDFIKVDFYHNDPVKIEKLFRKMKEYGV